MSAVAPVIPGFYPDPSICRVDKDYYLVTSSFEYFPGIPIFHSHDLIHWRQIGHCLTRESQLPLTVKPEKISHPLFGPNYSLGIYAPTIRHHDGTFYVVTTNVTDGRHFIVKADDPVGPWSEPIWIDVRDQLGFSIDPSLLFDDDGTVYFTCNGQPQAIYQCVIDPDTGEQITPLRHISDQFCAKDVEAPHLYHIDDWYYLLTAEGGTGYGHMAALGRSRSPWGPFEPSPINPILTHTGKVDSVQATGHADIVQAYDGSWWLVCLGVRPGAYPHGHHIGRETFLTPLLWQDGWFRVPDQCLQIPCPKFADDCTTNSFEAAIHETFASQTLSFQWNWLRNLDSNCWSLTELHGWLRLKGNPYSLDEQYNAPTFIGRRQQHLTCTVRCTIDFTPYHEYEEAGIATYMNALHHYEIVISSDNSSKRVVSLRRRIGNLQCIEKQIDIPSGMIELLINATPIFYQFEVVDSKGNLYSLGKAETLYLTTEVAGGFTGVYFALYATGNGYNASVPADFTDFYYDPLRENS